MSKTKVPVNMGKRIEPLRLVHIDRYLRAFSVQTALNSSNCGSSTKSIMRLSGVSPIASW